MSEAKTSKAKDSNLRTLTVALILCLVCSVMVSVAAISMQPKQQQNIEIDRNKNILMAANLFDPAKQTNADAQQLFKNVEVRLVDLKQGKFADEQSLKAVGITDVNAYDAIEAVKDPKLSDDVGEDDPARVGATPKFAKVYLIKDPTGSIKNVVLPINGYGLWGQIYGFITLKADINTVEGISFYQHKETPGLGALIEETKWRSQWAGKQAYDNTGKIITGVVKSGSPKPNPNYVDGVTGATITSAGVNNMIQFWLGERGYKPFLDNLRTAKAG
ncbi:MULTISPECIES: Na(+)-translocating NADH-quinone reductase subunit C [unclassified Moraxella]|uniref:Na(+)-translocating NADH-quinone reductase subunit C n=1 Tax=unclassified Moraxella TaxID=2685852 RepID=UPI003AF41710